MFHAEMLRRTVTDELFVSWLLLGEIAPENAPETSVRSSALHTHDVMPKDQHDRHTHQQACHQNQTMSDTSWSLERAF